jgi:hypothetical protein
MAGTRCKPEGIILHLQRQSGAADLYKDRLSRPTTDVEKAEVRLNLRNASIPAERRGELEIDPGERMISRAAPEPVVLADPNTQVPFIPDLGELRLDDAGRLLFLGGLASRDQRQPRRLRSMNTRTTIWFDDVSDGSVKARIRFADGSFVDADAAWVVAGPPDFAPSVGNAVSLYDLLGTSPFANCLCRSGHSSRRRSSQRFLRRRRHGWRTANSRSSVTSPRLPERSIPSSRARRSLPAQALREGRAHVSQAVARLADAGDNKTRA